MQFFVDNGFAGVAIKAGRDMCPQYLSEEFFDLLEQVLKMAQKSKIGVRIAEDFSLPWHNAFEKLTQANKQLRAQCLVLEHSELVPEKSSFEKKIHDPSTAIVQIARVVNDVIIASKIKTIPLPADSNVLSWKAPPGSWQVMIFRKKYMTDPMGNYVPNMFREQTARTYAETAWESLKRRFSKYMPLTFEGFISEVPPCLPADNTIPWDDDLAIKYRSKYKKDLVPLIPGLFFDAEAKQAKNRPHVFSFMVQSLHERFTLTLDKWCKKYRLSHWVLCPERPVQKSVNMLRDCLVVPTLNFECVGIQNQEGTEENAGTIRAMADANAREFKRETVTVIGRNRQGNAASFQSLKNEIDLAALSGPSRILLDGCFFTVDHRNCVKTPHNLSWYAPGAEHTLALCDYAARVKKLVSSIQSCRQVAVLMPSESMIADYLPGNDGSVRKGMLALHKTMDELSRLNLDFDILSEDQLLSCSLFSNGEFNSPSKARKGNYQALVVPYSRLVSKNLFVYLERMASKKSTIIFIDEAPQGTVDEGVTQQFAARVTKILRARSRRVMVSPAKDFDALLAHVKPLVSVTVQGKKCPDIVAGCGSLGSQTVYIIRNKSENQDYFAAMESEEEKYFYCIDCATGETHEIVDVQRKDDQCRINLNFAPKQTYYIVATSQKMSTTPLAKGKRADINAIGTVQRNYRMLSRTNGNFPLPRSTRCRLPPGIPASAFPGNPAATPTFTKPISK